MGEGGNSYYFADFHLKALLQSPKHNHKFSRASFDKLWFASKAAPTSNTHVSEDAKHECQRLDSVREANVLNINLWGGRSGSEC